MTSLLKITTKQELSPQQKDLVLTIAIFVCIFQMCIDGEQWLMQRNEGFTVLSNRQVFFFFSYEL